jgi:hypothetical protein
MAEFFVKWGHKRARLKVDEAPSSSPPMRAYLERKVLEYLEVKPGDIVVVTTPGFLTYAHYTRAVADIIPPEYEGRGIILLSHDRFVDLGVKKGTTVIVWKHSRWF